MRRLSVVILSRGYSLFVVLGLYIAVASHAAEDRFRVRRLQWLQHVGSVAVTHRLRAPQ